MTKNIPPRDRLIFALDVPTLREAKNWVARLGEAANFYKLGLELLMSGSYFELIDWLLTQDKRVFADLKFFDVPQTVAAAVRQLNGRGISFTTVHDNDAILQAAFGPIQGKACLGFGLRRGDLLRIGGTAAAP